MDASEGIRIERCARVPCQVLFGICRPCYRAQWYCGPPCKTAARTESKRRARARHQASPEGRDDHRDREQARRKREAEVTSVTDHSPSFLAPMARVCPPDDPPSPIPGEVVILGEGRDDETRTDCATDYDSGGDPHLGADGRRRGAQGSFAALLLGATAAPASTADAARSDGVVAPGAGARCRFCARRGLVVGTWPRRGSRRRRIDRPLHRLEAAPA
jgi:hypothetical protein